MENLLDIFDRFLKIKKNQIKHIRNHLLIRTFSYMKLKFIQRITCVSHVYLSYVISLKYNLI